MFRIGAALATIALLCASATVSSAQAAPPVLRYTDLSSGPNAGGQNNGGAFVTIYGVHFGASRQSSTVTVGGGQVLSYPVWSDTKVTVQLGSAAVTGQVVVTTAAGASNGLPFTVRSGNIYFVATNGSDSNNGSYTAPWQTILKARDTIQAGDIVYAMNGVSQPNDDGQGWSTSMLLRRGGTAGAPMAFVVYPGATASIGSVTGPTYGIRGVDTGTLPGYLVFAGFTLRGASSAMVLAGPSTDWRIIGNDMSCPNGNGEVGCFATSKASNVLFYGNNVHDAGVAAASAHYHAVYWSTDSNHWDMGWNTIANVHGCRGIQTHSSPLGSGGSGDPTGHNLYDISIHDNLIHDTQCDGIILATVDPSQGKVEVYNNIIYNAGLGPNNPENTGAWTCINVPGTTANGAAGGGLVEVYNNTMYNCGSFANPPYANANAAVENGGNNTNLKIHLRNNLMYQLSSEPYLVIYGPADGIQGTDNLFYGNGAAPVNANIAGSLNTDPLFASLTNHDFHITAASPVATAGTTTPQTRDFDSVSLPQGAAFPIGALAYPLTGGGSTVSVSVSPASASLKASGTQQFTATVAGASNTSVTWSLSPATGTLSTTGLYTAPASIASQQTVTITATSAADTTKTAHATVTLNPAISVTVTPTTATLSANQTQQFQGTVSGATNTAVTWSLSPSVGTVSTSGLYTAPSSITASQTVTVTATSAADTTRTAAATVTLMPPVAVSVAPGSVSLKAAQTQTFTATVSGSSNTAVKWTLSPAVGAISSNGVYTAPASVTTSQNITVVATAAGDATKTGSATVTLVPAVTVGVSPASVSLKAGQSQAFTATVSGSSNSAVTWTLSPAVGTLSSAGVYTAPSTITAAQTVVITATSAASTTSSASATVVLTPAVSVSLTPASVTLNANGTQQFSASVSGTSSTAVTWSLSPAAGTLTSSGLYTAPATISAAQTVTVTATSSADTTKSATATITLNAAAATGNYSVNWALVSGTQYKVSWTAPSGQSASDYVALSGAGAPAWWYAWTTYTRGATSGSATFTMPTTPGFYEIRYYHQGGYTIMARSGVLAWNTSSFTLAAGTTAVSRGAALSVKWTDPTGRPSSDSVGLYPVTAANDADVWHQYPNGVTSGAYTIAAPTTPGAYEFRWRVGYLVTARSGRILVQ